MLLLENRMFQFLKCFSARKLKQISRRSKIASTHLPQPWLCGGQKVGGGACLFIYLFFSCSQLQIRILPRDNFHHSSTPR